VPFRDAGLLGEHGFSFWLDTGAQRVLFDTAQGIALEKNAAKLGIDLGQADAISTDFMEREDFGKDRIVRRVTEPAEVVRGAWVTGGIPRTNNFEDVGGSPSRVLADLRFLSGAGERVLAHE